MIRRYDFNDNTRIDIIENENAASVRIYVHGNDYNLRQELQSEELRDRIKNIVADIEPKYYNKEIADIIHEKWMTRFIAWTDTYMIHDHRHSIIDNNIDVWFHIDIKDMIITWFKY